MPSFQLCFENVLFIFFTYDMSFHKEYYLINFLLLLAKFSIHKCKYGDYKPLFLILKSEVKQYLKSIYTLINKKAVKRINICEHFHLCLCGKNYSTRSSNGIKLVVPRVHSEHGKSSFSYYAPCLWNEFLSNTPLETIPPLNI